jgi:hypothetical protein
LKKRKATPNITDDNATIHTNDSNLKRNAEKEDVPLVTLEEDALPFFFVCEAVVLVDGVLRDGWYAAFLLRPAMMVLVEGRSPEAAACCVGERRGKEEGVTASSPLN